MPTRWLRNKTDRGVELARIVVDDESGELSLSSTVAGIAEWVEETWSFEPAAERARFVSRHLAALKRQGYTEIDKRQFTRGVSARAKQELDDEPVQPTLRRELHEADATEEMDEIDEMDEADIGTVQLAQAREWWELSLEDVGTGVISYTKPRRRTPCEIHFNIEHEQSQLIANLVSKRVSDMIQELEERGYKHVSRAKLERLRARR